MDTVGVTQTSAAVMACRQSARVAVRLSMFKAEYAFACVSVSSAIADGSVRLLRRNRQRLSLTAIAGNTHLWRIWGNKVWERAVSPALELFAADELKFFRRMRGVIQITVLVAALLIPASLFLASWTFIHRVRTFVRYSRGPQALSFLTN